MYSLFYAVEPSEAVIGICLNDDLSIDYWPDRQYLQKSLKCIDDLFHLNIARIRGSRKDIASSAVKYFCCGVPIPIESIPSGACFGSCLLIIRPCFHFALQNYNFFLIYANKSEIFDKNPTYKQELKISKS